MASIAYGTHHIECREVLHHAQNFPSVVSLSIKPDLFDGFDIEASSSAPSRSLQTQFWRRPIIAQLDGACRARDQAVKDNVEGQQQSHPIFRTETWGNVKILPDTQVPVPAKIRLAGPLKKLPLSCTTTHNPHASDNFTSLPNFHGRFPFHVCLLLSAALRALLRFSSDYRWYLDFRHIPSRRQDERRGKKTMLLPCGLKPVNLHQLHQTPNSAGVKLVALSPTVDAAEAIPLPPRGLGAGDAPGRSNPQPVRCQPSIFETNTRPPSITSPS